MTPPLRKRSAKPWARAGWLLLTALAAPLAHSQSACSSDGQPAPSVLFERFTPADCASCWADPATPSSPPNALTLDWLVPGSQGDAAALAAVANSDARVRLAALQRSPVASQDHLLTAIPGAPTTLLRVAHGPAVGHYMGVLISLRLPPNTALALPVTGWVVLLETVPVGTAGSPVPRYLVKNALQPLWHKGEQLLNQEGLDFNEVRAMSLPEGVPTNRLRVAGWVQDAQGQMLAAVQSACEPTPEDEAR